MVYRWADKTPDMYRGFDVNTVGAEIVALAQKNKGRLTSNVVVAAAKNVESPLHPLFLWDDTKAAMMYRKVQARQIVRCLVVVKSDTPAGASEGKPALSHVMVQHSDGSSHHGYVTANKTRRDNLYRPQVVEKALRELRDWYDRYWDLVELSDFIVLIEENWPKQVNALPEKKHVTSAAS